MRTPIRILILLWAALQGCQSGPAADHAGTPPALPPKLVVVVVIDGLGQHQFAKFRDKVGDGGFRRLYEGGASFSNASYGHSTTVTAVGHSTIVTGAYPYRHGLISNDWYDRKTKETVFCVEDAGSKYIGE